MISLILFIIITILLILFTLRLIKCFYIENFRFFSKKTLGIIYLMVASYISIAYMHQSTINLTERHNKLLLSQKFDNIELNPYSLLPCEVYKELKASQDSLYDGLIVKMATKYQDKIDEMYKECN